MNDPDNVVDPVVLAERRARRAELAEEELRELLREAELGAATLKGRLAAVEGELATARTQRDAFAADLARREKELLAASRREHAEQALRSEAQTRAAEAQTGSRRELDDLRVRLVAAEQRAELFTQMEQEVADRLERAHAAERELAVLRGEVASRQAEIAHLREELERHAEGALRAAAGEGEVDPQLATRITAERTEFAAQVAAVEHTLATLRPQLAEAAEALVERLTAERARRAEAEAALHAERERVAELEEELEAATSRREAIVAVVAELGAAIDELRERFATELDARVAELSTTADALRSELGDEQRLRSVAEEELERLRAAREEALSELERERESRVAAEAARVEAEAAHAEAQAAHAEAQAAYADAQAAHAHAKAAHAEAQAELERHAHARAELEAEAERHAGAHAQAQAELERQLAVRAERDEAQAEQARALEEVERHQGELERRQGELLALQEAYAEVQAEAQRHDAARAEAQAELERQLAAQAQSEEAQAEQARALEEVERRQAELERRQAEFIALQAELAREQAQHAAAQSELGREQELRAAAEAELDRERALLAQTAAELEALRSAPPPKPAVDIEELTRAAERLRAQAPEPVPVEEEPAPAPEPPAEAVGARDLSEQRDELARVLAAQQEAAEAAGALERHAHLPALPIAAVVPAQGGDGAWLREGIRQVGNADPALGAELLLALAPVQAHAVRRPVAYELTVTDVGTWRIALAESQATIDRGPSEEKVAFRISGTPGELAPLFAGGGRRKLRAHREGSRFALWRLARARSDAPTLAEAVAAGGDFSLRATLGLLAAITHEGGRSVVAFDDGDSPITAVATRRGAVLLRSGIEQPQATLHAPEHELVALLAGLAPSAPVRVSGDAAVASAFIARLHRAQGLV